MNEKEIYKLAIEKWGEDLQMVMAIEEFSELQKVICKVIRGPEEKLQALYAKDIFEEIADCEIMIGQLKEMFGHDLCIEIKQRKLARLAIKLETGNWQKWEDISLERALIILGDRKRGD